MEFTDLMDVWYIGSDIFNKKQISIKFNSYAVF